MNILLIHSDQHRYDCLGVNGHPIVKTPNLDKLASEGMNFSNAYTPIPLCVPTRNCQLFGCHTFQHGVIANFDTEACPRHKPDIPAYSELLKQAEYISGYVGKWHVHPELSPLDFGFDDYISIQGYREWRHAQGQPDYCSSCYFGAVDKCTSNTSLLAYQADKTIELLEKYAESDKPFMLRWDPSEPHLPNIVPEPYASMYSPENIPEWPGFGDDFVNKPYAQKQQLLTWGINGWTWRDWAPIVSRYLGEISLLDEQVGRILKRLDDLGLTEETIIIYTSDHGDMCGSHGMFDKHYVLYDDVIRVPMIIKHPAMKKRGCTYKYYVYNELNLPVTILDVAGILPPEEYQGRSLIPLLNGEGFENKKDIFCYYHGNQMGLYTQRCVRNNEWKYIWNANSEDELYDLKNDPGEVVNLAFSAEYSPIMEKLRLSLLEYMRQYKDTVLNYWTRGLLTGDTPGKMYKNQQGNRIH